jgi:hypothetical protein
VKTKNEILRCFGSVLEKGGGVVRAEYCDKLDSACFIPTLRWDDCGSGAPMRAITDALYISCHAWYYGVVESGDFSGI